MKQVSWRLVAWAALSLNLGSAQAARYHRHDIVIDGASFVAATAINDQGTIVGIYAVGTTYAGFALTHGVLTTLPGLCPGVTDGCIPTPTAVTDNGNIGGYYDAGGILAGFIWHDGGYAQDTDLVLGSYGCEPETFALNQHGFVAFNQCQGSSTANPFAGHYTAPAQLPIGNFAFARTVNRHDDVAGAYYPVAGNTVIPSLFIYSPDGKLVSVLPKGAQAASGGFINDNKQVAGTDVDAGGATHGFLFRDRDYTTFDVPGHATQITAQAIDNAGRVAGTYVDAAAGTQRIFVYTGTQVNTFGSFGQSDMVTVSMNNQGVMVVTDNAVALTQSFRVTCTGSGC